jgi:hypothetical protein
MAVTAGGASAATHDPIGSWVLSCPSPTSRTDAEPCRLRLARRFLDKAGVTGDLEVEEDGKALVPVLALRGLPTQLLMTAALAGKTEAWMQFDGGPRQALDCGPDTAAYICTPRDDAVRILAAELPAARTVTVRVTVTVAGMKPLPVQEKSLELTGTGEALARLRAAGPAQVPGPMASMAFRTLASQPPDRLMDMADKALRAAGYPNGVADLRGLLNKYMRK